VSDSVELVGSKAAEVIFGDLAVAEQGGEDLGQHGVAIVEVAVDAAAALAEPGFQFPEFGGFRDLCGAFLRIPNDAFEFPSESQVEGAAGGSGFPLATTSTRASELPSGCVRRSCSLLPGGILAPGGWGSWHRGNPPFRVRASIPKSTLPSASAVG
jgi:hypothetical protein